MAPRKLNAIIVALRLQVEENCFHFFVSLDSFLCYSFEITISNYFDDIFKKKKNFNFEML